MPEKQSMAQGRPIITHLLTLIIGFALPVLTGVGGHLADGIYIRFRPTMEVKIQEASLTNASIGYYGDDVVSKSAHLRVKFNIQNKKFANTWVKLLITLNGHEVENFHFFSNKGPSKYLTQFEMHESGVDFSAKVEKIPVKGEKLKINITAYDSFGKKCSDATEIVADL
ncbi:hypothetical protein ACFL5U_00050 [Candidatus Margulisiibacteriota bacterium]